MILPWAGIRFYLNLNDFDSKLIDKRSRNVLSVAEPSMTNTNVLTVLNFFFKKNNETKRMWDCNVPKVDPL